MKPTIVSCAVTGGDDSVSKSKFVPVTPEQISCECLAAADAGAAIVHIHVRDIATGKSSMNLDYYREVVRRIRASESDVLINLTTGPGARFIPGSEGNSMDAASNLCTPEERVRHVVDLRPDICSLDMGTLNFGTSTLINVPSHIERMSERIKAAGVLPELEIFDSGHMAFALDMVRRGLLSRALLFQFALGTHWGAPATPVVTAALASMVPKDAQWAAFGVGRQAFPMVAQSFLLGGHVRVGLEDNLYLGKGELSPGNAPLVKKAVRILSDLGGRAATTVEARSILGCEARVISPA